MAAATGFRHGRHYSRTPLDSTFTFGKKTNPADEPPTNLPRESHVKYRSVYQSMTSDADNFWEEAQDNSQLIKDTLNLSKAKKNRAASENASVKTAGEAAWADGPKTSVASDTYTKHVSDMYIKKQVSYRPSSAQLCAMERRKNKSMGQKSSVSLGWS